MPQIIGTLDIISKEERDLVAGFIINKFRGDPGLFEEGISYIEARTKKPVLGLVPWFNDIEIDEEDAASLGSCKRQGSVKGENHRAKLRIAAVRLPCISNFTDLDALAQEPRMSLWNGAPRLPCCSILMQ